MLGSSLENEEHRWTRVLYYGKPGSGKSTNIASMANRGPIVIIDMEDGYERDALAARGINTKNITLFKPRTYEEIEQCYWEIKGMIDGGIDLYGVGIDHWSEIQDLLIRHAAMRRIGKKKAELKKLIAVSAEAKMEYDALSVFRTDLPDYGEWTEQGKVLLRFFRDLQCHVAFASHETNEDSTGMIVPMQSDKFQKKLMAGVRTVVYTRATEIKGEGRFEFTGVTKPVERFSACKDRTAKLPTVLINPSMDRIVDVLNDELDVTHDEAQIKYLARKSAAKK